MFLPGGLSQYTGGVDVLDVEAPRVHELKQALTARFPALADRLDQLAVAIDGEIYNEAPYHRLESRSEVYFIPRVAGGMQQ